MIHRWQFSGLISTYRTQDYKINEFPGLMVDHVYVQFGDATVFETSCRKTNKQTDRHTNAAENHTHSTAVGVGNNAASAFTDRIITAMLTHK